MDGPLGFDHSVVDTGRGMREDNVGLATAQARSLLGFGLKSALSGQGG
jgi:hypothetical protein